MAKAKPKQAIEQAEASQQSPSLEQSDQLVVRDKTSELFAILLLGLALLLAFLLWAPQSLTGALGRGFSSLTTGLLGTFSLALPILFALLAGAAYIQKPGLDRWQKSSYFLIFIIVIIGLLSVLTLDLSKLEEASLKEGRHSAWEAVKLYWQSGGQPGLLAQGTWWSGGLIGNILAVGLISLVGKTGSLILLIPMLFALAILIFGVSWRQTFRKTAEGVSQTGKFLGNWGKDLLEKRIHMQDNQYKENPQFNSEATSDFGPVDSDSTGNFEQPVEPRPTRPKFSFEFPEGNWLKDDFGNAPALEPIDQPLAENRQTDFFPPRLQEDFPLDLETRSGQPIENTIRPAFIPLKHEYLMFAQTTEERGEDLLDVKSTPGSTQPKLDRVLANDDLAEIASRIQEGEDNFGDDSREDWEDRSASDTNAKKVRKFKAGQTNIFANYLPPSSDLLIADEHAGEAENKEEIRLLGAKLETTLQDFGVQAKVVNFMTGPTISRFEVKPGPGVKVSRIVNLSDDIALALAASSVRIEAPIPGKSAVGIEIPNKKTQAVRLRNILESQEFKHSKSLISAALGRNIQGEPILCDLSSMPHLLIAGATGSGKSVCINAILISLLYKASPQDLRLVMIDPKVVELSVYNGIPHLETPVVTDPKKAYGVLEWAVKEMERRYRLFADNSVRDFKAYNELVRQGSVEDGEYLPYILLVIDELSDLMATTPTEVEDAIARLTSMARAAGIHLIIATQRPSVDVITGVIKANIPSRISFAVASQVDSRTILDMGGAEKLLGKGDMLYYPQSASKPLRGQGAFVTDAEVERVVSYLKGLYATDYNEELRKDLENVGNPQIKSGALSSEEDEEDDLLYEALRTVLESDYASVSLLQRRLNVGYPRAARMVDTMHERGWVGPFEGSKPRKLTISKEEAQEIIDLNS